MGGGGEETSPGSLLVASYEGTDYSEKILQPVLTGGVRRMREENHDKSISWFWQTIQTIFGDVRDLFLSPHPSLTKIILNSAQY